MILNSIGSVGPLGIAIIAFLVGGGLLIVVMFAGGRPSDIKGQTSWQTWAIAGLVLFALLFFLGRSLSTMSGTSYCSPPSQYRC